MAYTGLQRVYIQSKDVKTKHSEAVIITIKQRCNFFFSSCFHCILDFIYQDRNLNSLYTSVWGYGIAMEPMDIDAVVRL